MATLPNSINTDLSRGFTVSQVAEKHNWTEPMVWSLAPEDKEDLERFKELGWGLRTEISCQGAKLRDELAADERRLIAAKRRKRRKNKKETN